MKKYWYLKIRFKDWYGGRKIWYQNDGYLCDCINLPFADKEKCEACIPRIIARYGNDIEDITLHWTK